MRYKFIFFFILFLIPNHVYSKNIIEIPLVSAKNILLYNLSDDEVIYEKDIFEKIEIASLTKIMTALVAIENTEDIEKQIKVPNYNSYNLIGYTKAGFKENDLVTIKDLLYGLLLPSGADAAIILALETFNDVDNFVLKMNELAKTLEMNDTHYDNPYGKDSEFNYSTINDLSKLLKYALKNEVFYEIYTTRKYVTSNNLELESTLNVPSTTYNLDTTNILGSKSGFTKEAGLCLSSISSYNGKEYLLIITNSNYLDNFPNHILDTINIYNYFYQNYSYQFILTPNQVLKTIPIKNGVNDLYTIYSDINKEILIKNNSKIEYIYEGEEEINKNISINTHIGDIKIYVDNNLAFTYPIYLKENIRYKKNYLVIGLIIFSFLIFASYIKYIKSRKSSL